MLNTEMKHSIKPRKKDRDTYHLLSQKAKDRRRLFGLDEDRLIEHIEKEKLEKFRLRLEEYYGESFSTVMTNAINIKYDLKEIATLMYLFTQEINENVDEKEFRESFPRISPYFIWEALRTIKAAVESGGKKPVVWRVDILCKR